jgi:uncharacterized protein (TIGR01244 family)
MSRRTPARPDGRAPWVWQNLFMKNLRLPLFALLVTLLLAGLVPAGLAAQPAPPSGQASMQVHPAALLPNGRSPLPGVLTGGQPDTNQLAELAKLGYKTVINLRKPGERGEVADEASVVKSHGMSYVSIPVGHGEGLDRENAEVLGKILANRDARPVVIHCASGNRVGALLALEEAWVQGRPPEKALELGKAAGLTSLEPQVRKILGLDSH